MWVTPYKYSSSFVFTVFSSPSLPPFRKVRYRLFHPIVFRVIGDRSLPCKSLGYVALFIVAHIFFRNEGAKDRANFVSNNSLKSSFIEEYFISRNFKSFTVTITICTYRGDSSNNNIDNFINDDERTWWNFPNGSKDILVSWRKTKAPSWYIYGGIMG